MSTVVSLHVTAGVTAGVTVGVTAGIVVTLFLLRVLCRFLAGADSLRFWRAWSRGDEEICRSCFELSRRKVIS